MARLNARGNSLSLRTALVAGSCLTIAAMLPNVGYTANRAIDLMPHQAEYELKMIRSDQSADIQDVRGTFRYEITGNVCSGYTVNVELKNRVVNRGGQVTQVDQYTTSFEDPTLGIYTFEERQDINGRTVESTKGQAESANDEVKVSVRGAANGPAEETVIASAVRFPVQFMMDTITAARAGDIFINRHYYDGSEGGQVAFDTSGVIGRRVENAAASNDAFADMDIDGEGWRVSLAYFKQDAEAAKTDQVPDYQITFTLFEHGVSSDLKIDYGDFVISGDMTAFEALPRQACEN